jgi:uncharacterized protein with von Willebrand factor type A (vWA) domain
MVVSQKIEDLVCFCRALREHGLAVTPSEVVVATDALKLIDAADREEVFISLRSILTTRVEDFPTFAELFKTFWERLPQKLVPSERESKTEANALRLATGPTNRGIGFFLDSWSKARHNRTEPINLPSASNANSAGEKDFSSFTSHELEQVAELARRIVRRLARNPGRRWRPVRRGPRVNLRRTLRQSLKVGGEIVELSYRKRRPKRTKLIVICDVSASMDIYSRVLLQFVYGLQNTFAKVETFVFSTSLSRITGYLKNRTYQRALERLSSKVQGWSGGTRIGDSLTEFNAKWLRRIDKRTIVMILSDGWDTGEPEQLAAALSEIQKRAGRLIWLNPLLGSESYQPLTRGMQAALPFINVFAAAHDLASLRALEPHFVL